VGEAGISVDCLGDAGGRHTEGAEREEEAMTDLTRRRQFLAEEIAACAVPRQAFLPPGPWTVRGPADMPGRVRQTPDANPQHVNHNVSVAIDADRELFNGAPTAVAPLLDALGLSPGGRVLHVGCGLGYYTAIIAQVVGPAGRVVAIEADGALAGAAARNLDGLPWVTVVQGDGSKPEPAPVDAILVHAGVTHPLNVWLDTLSAGGRLVLAITSALPPMGSLGKGLGQPQ
jgi:protein-L-isoaspartate(D-aspartate) O-methyltransferase